MSYYDIKGTHNTKDMLKPHEGVQNKRDMHGAATHTFEECRLNGGTSIKTETELKQDAREAMRVVFFCTHKTYICMHKTKFLMNIFKYCFKNYIKLQEFANCNSANYDV